MKRDAVNDSWEYVKLGKQVSASEIQTNKVVYQMYNLLSIVLGGHMSVGLFRMYYTV